MRSGINGRIKGKNFEREIAEMFEAWYGKPFRRTPNSGGLAIQAREIAGDLICDDPAFPFLVEIKKHEGWELSSILLLGRRRFEETTTESGKDRTCEILAWWNQAVREAKGIKRIPMLVFSKNYHQPVAVVPYSSVFLGPSRPKVFFLWAIYGVALGVILLQDFFAAFSPEYVIEQCREMKGMDAAKFFIGCKEPVKDKAVRLLVRRKNRDAY